MYVKKHIPNAITCCNLFSGCIACVMAFNGAFDLAMGFIVLGAVFDFFDGMVARLLRVSSPLGVQMDSLADDITFGIAPATIVFNYMNDVLYYPGYLGCFSEIIPYMAFLIAVFSACRLAKFNVDTRQTNTFIGLPTPANALFWSSLVTGAGHWIFNLNAGWVLMIGLILLSSYLLVSEIPMFSLKFKNFSWRCNKTRYVFLVVALPMLVLGYLAPVAIIAWYLLLSVVLYIKGTRP
ncbi:MAG: CDP-diacylglycerol--serine O-phosphatidyltransferase [Bacteroidaceae bacterium]|nr:CDP-diacylglycerol--serine O-phosphatidyltransferase [Bacteroidaceae bacterium]